MVTPQNILTTPNAAGSVALPAEADVGPIVQEFAVTMSVSSAADDSSYSEETSAIAAVTSPAAISVYSSLLFHLAGWAIAFLVCQLLGLRWDLMSSEPLPPMMAALGDNEIADDMPLLELIGEISTDLEQPSSTVQQLALQLQQSDSASLTSTLDDVWKNIPGGDASDQNQAGSGSLLKVPASGLAVTKGSFTAFTIPANPAPLQQYLIVIEVRLPSDIRKYHVADLVGTVRGTDGHKQNIPYDKDFPSASGYPVESKELRRLDSSTVLEVSNNRIQIVIKVPGARKRLVKDTIRIRSRKLKEEQELTLVFGQPVAGSSGNPYDAPEVDSPKGDDAPQGNDSPPKTGDEVGLPPADSVNAGKKTVPE